MKFENRILKGENVNRIGPILALQSKPQKRIARRCAQGKNESKREGQRNAVLIVLRLWSEGELSRSAPEME